MSLRLMFDRDTDFGGGAVVVVENEDTGPLVGMALTTERISVIARRSIYPRPIYYYLSLTSHISLHYTTLHYATMYSILIMSCE